MRLNDDKNEQSGVLYGIGVGPGDPDLIPVKAVKILNRVDVVFAASSTKNQHSQAVNIARPHIPMTTPVVHLAFPMTKDEAAKEKAWQDNTCIILDALKQGKDVAFLTLGDSMMYATYGYIVTRMRAIAPNTRVETVPGISSFQAAAALTNTPLMEGEESLTVLSGVMGGEQLRTHLATSDNIVLLKAYRKVDDIVATLSQADLLENSFAIVNVGLPDEEIIHDIRKLTERDPGYWTLIIVKQKKDV